LSYSSKAKAEASAGIEPCQDKFAIRKKLCSIQQERKNAFVLPPRGCEVINQATQHRRRRSSHEATKNTKRIED